MYLWVCGKTERVSKRLRARERERKRGRQTDRDREAVNLGYASVVFCVCRQGVDMKRPRMTYWQEGLTIEFSGGSIVVESAVFIASEEQRKYPGILISIFTNSPCLADLAVTGFVTDEIDSTLQNVFPRK